MSFERDRDKTRVLLENWVAHYHLDNTRFNSNFFIFISMIVLKAAWGVECHYSLT